MKKLFTAILGVLFLSTLSFAQDDISQGTGIIGNGRYLGAKTADNQTTVPVLGVSSNGDTVVNSLSTKGVIVQVNKTPVAAFGAVSSVYETVAGAGTTVADAAALSATKFVHQITGADGTKGWKFTTSTPIGSVQTLLNTTAGVAKIYAESGGTVNGGSVDAAFSALTGIKPIICVKTAALTYICS